MDGYKRIAVVYEWWSNGYPLEADETVLFATETDANAYRDARGTGQVFQRDVFAPVED